MDAPAKSFWDAIRQLKFDQPLEADDPRRVDTAAARGDFTFNDLCRLLGIDLTTNRMESEPDRVYALFCGHRGCGKSTELRQLVRRLDDPKRLCVVFVDAVEEVDVHNLQYVDVLMALAKALFSKVQELGVTVPDVFLSKLRTWFAERVEKHEKTKDYAAEVKSGASAEGGIPWFAKLFTSVAATFRISSTHKEELRQVIKNSYSEFAESFNQLVVAVEEELHKHGKGRKILFVVDGTDQLNDADSHRFFVGDVHQLQLIESNFVYCAPISLLYEGGQVQQMFEPIVLPMIKLREKRNPARLAEGYECLRAMIYKRIHPGLFDSEETVDYLIEHSGGNPRHVLRLLSYAFQRAQDKVFDRTAAEKAVAALATEMRRFLETEDYELLHQIDDNSEEINSERVRKLLYNLALLEYNSYWRMSHPVIRTLDAYRRLAKKPSP
jgi:energy-coupling factor transporter ATP-binding protein EcfA2